MLTRAGLEAATPSEARREALARLHQREARLLYGYVWRRTGDAHLAEDITSDVFVRAFEQREDLGPSAETHAWLLRVASRFVSRWARRRRILGWLSLMEEELELPAAREERRGPDVERVRAALLSLPPRFQSVLALHYVEGLEPERVAHVLDLPVGTVHSRLSRGRERLRRNLERRTER